MNSIETYLEHIESICGQEGRYYKITDEGERPPVSVVSYANLPRAGWTTAFSYGLSSINHPEWINSRPELVISVDSLDLSWSLAMGEIIRNGRKTDLFSYGTIINFGEPISDESDMSSFLVFACSVLDQDDLSVQLPDRKIHLSQIYPVYASEAAVIQMLGAERFVREVGTELFNVKRAPHS